MTSGGKIRHLIGSSDTVSQQFLYNDLGSYCHCYSRSYSNPLRCLL